jgi:hypothetical protein
VDHVVRFGARNIDALFLMLGSDRYGFHKIHAGTTYAELVFLHLMVSGFTLCLPVRPGRETLMYYFSCSGGTGSASTKSVVGHIMMNLCFCIRWDLWVKYCILVRKTSTYYFSCSTGTSTNSTKSRSRHVTPNMYFFASDGICGSCSAFRCVKHRYTIFQAGVEPIWIPQKAC